ncbi:hypothetical protein ACFU8W_49325 [Streptomyces sp. NPDC057565]|uniref:hypothetical protein n=1 Tax=Streptomyces sp. NPDC057565 TaxID=3346169 RepID=UPI00369B3738
MGQIESRIPDLGVEQELAQSLMRTETNGMTDRQVLSDVLSRPENRYLARQMCYVLTIQGLMSSCRGIHRRPTEPLSS